MLSIRVVVLLCILLMSAVLPVAHAQSEAEPNTELRTYHNWSVRCVRPEEGDKACSLFQRVNLKDGRQLLMIRIEKNVVRDQEEGPVEVAVVTAPMGVYLPTGVALQVDELDPATIDYEHCDRNGCHAALVMEEALTTSLREGEECKISFHNLSGEKLTATLSLKGFTAGYDSF